MAKKIVVFCLLIFTGLTFRLYGEETLHDPMRPLSYQPAAVRQHAEPEKNDFQLGAVLISAQRSVAVINGRAVQLGGQIAGYRLVTIEPSRVVLKKNKKQIELRRSGTGLKKATLFGDVKKGSQP